jgi:hypothetical protein
MAQNTQELSLTTLVLFYRKCKDRKSITPKAFLTELEARQTQVRGGESETRTCSEDIQTREKPSKTAATGSREHGGGGTGTARAATGLREHGAGPRTTRA